MFYRKRSLDLTNKRNHRLQSRLTNLEDSCVNGFLLPEQMPHIYKELTAMPEILSDLATYLRRLDLQNEYFSKKKCYIASIKVPIVDLTFDDFQYETDSIEKTKLILKYVFNFLYFKSHKNTYCFIYNPIIRLPDNKSIGNEDIVAICEITDFKDFFA